MDNCTTYFKKHEYERARDIYITDMLWGVNKMFIGDKGDLIRFADMLYPQKEEQPPKSVDEVKDSIRNKIRNLKGKEDAD